MSTNLRSAVVGSFLLTAVFSLPAQTNWVNKLGVDQDVRSGMTVLRDDVLSGNVVLPDDASLVTGLRPEGPTPPR